MQPLCLLCSHFQKHFHTHYTWQQEKASLVFFQSIQPFAFTFILQLQAWWENTRGCHFHCWLSPSQNGQVQHFFISRHIPERQLMTQFLHPILSSIDLEIKLSCLSFRVGMHPMISNWRCSHETMTHILPFRSVTEEIYVYDHRAKLHLPTLSSITKELSKTDFFFGSLAKYVLSLHAKAQT